MLKNLPTTSSSGELTTYRIGSPWSLMSATDLAHDDDDDDYDDAMMMMMMITMTILMMMITSS